MQRPVSVTVFGILNIVFGILGVLGIFATVALLALMSSGAGGNANPMIKFMRESPAYSAWIKLTIPLGVAVSGVLLASGIGLLKMKGWARKLSIGYAIYALIFGLANFVVSYWFLLRPMMEEAARKQGPEAAGAIGGAIGGSVGGCFGLIYPILLLIFMTRPKVVAAFAPSAASSELPPG